MTVEFYSYSNGENEEKVGSITLKDGKLEAEGVVANNALQFAIRDSRNGESVTAQSDPQRFLELLHEEYSSPYTWATMPID